MHLWFLFLCLILLFVELSCSTVTIPTCSKMRIFIPAYIYPPWNGIIEKGVQFIIANPDSGPGSSTDSNYVTAINAARNASISVLGYVHTSYGKRNISTVMSEVQQYKNFSYNINGIFFDEASSSFSELEYYMDLYTQTKAMGYLVYLNPGTFPVEAYMNVSDGIVTFEDVYTNYETYGDPPAWVANYTSDRFITLIYSMPYSYSVLAATMKLICSRNVEYMFLTDISGNPYGSLPDFWNEELLLATGVNGTPSLLSSNCILLMTIILLSTHFMLNSLLY
jgi:hypothetical protein